MRLSVECGLPKPQTKTSYKSTNNPGLSGLLTFKIGYINLNPTIYSKITNNCEP